MQQDGCHGAQPGAGECWVLKPAVLQGDLLPCS